MTQVDLTRVRSTHSFAHRVERQLWGIVWATLFRFSPRPLFGWRRFVLRLFGAQLAEGTRVYPSTKVWYPRNLVMGPHSRLGADVDCYNVDRIEIGGHVVVSQYSYLCGATHDHEDPHFALVPHPITIGNGVWIAADVFIAPGVSIGESAVVGARSSVFKDVEPFAIVAGSPARPIGQRALRSPSISD